MTILKATSLSALADLVPFRNIGNSRSLLFLHKLLLMLFVSLAFALPCPAAVTIHKVSLSSDTQVATAGYFQLSWHGDEKLAQYRLLESDNPLFNDSAVVYQGPDLATVISGKPNGDYFYRVVELKDNTPLTVSNTIKVQVHHHALAKAFAFFAIGATVFLATLLLILWGNRKSQSGDS